MLDTSLLGSASKSVDAKEVARAASASPAPAAIDIRGVRPTSNLRPRGEAPTVHDAGEISGTCAPHEKSGHPGAQHVTSWRRRLAQACARGLSISWARTEVRTSASEGNWYDASFHSARL